MKKAIYTNIVVSFLSVILNLTFKVYVAHTISKNELALYFTSIDIFTMTLLVLVGFRSSMVVTFAQTKDDEKIINTFRIVLIVALLLVWALVIPYLMHVLKVHVGYWYLVFTAIALSSSVYFSNMIAMYRLYNIINKTTFLEPAFMIIWFMVFMYLFDTRGLKPLFLSTIFTAFSISLFIYFKKRATIETVKLKKPKWDNITSKFLKNSLISTIEFGSGIVMMYTAVLLMIKYYPLGDLGDFQVVSKPVLTYMIMMFVFPIFRFVLPELSKLYKEKRYDKIKSIKKWVYGYSFIVSFAFVIFSLFFSDMFVKWLFPASYSEASLMIKHLSFFFIFIMLNAYQISMIKASGDFLSALLIRAWGIVSLVVIFYLIYNLYSKNIISVVVSLAGSYVSMFLVSYFKERTILNKINNTNL